MLFNSVLAASALLVGAQARFVKRSDGITIHSQKLGATRAPLPIAVTDVVVPLVRQKQSSKHSSKFLHSLVVANGDTTTLTSLETG